MENIRKEYSLDSFRTTWKEYENIYYELSKTCGISEAEYWTLLMVFEGVTSQTEISEQLLLSKQTVNSACKKLIKRGYIRLETVENNLRAKQICLTDSGVEFAEANIRCLSAAEEYAWNELSADEQRALVEYTRKFNILMKSKLQNRID